MSQVHENEAGMRDSRFGCTPGTIWVEIPITEYRMGLPYETLKDIVIDGAKMEAENALHEAMHYRCGFECAGYVVPEETE